MCLRVLKLGVPLLFAILIWNLYSSPGLDCSGNVDHNDWLAGMRAVTKVYAGLGYSTTTFEYHDDQKLQHILDSNGYIVGVHKVSEFGGAAVVYF